MSGPPYVERGFRPDAADFFFLIFESGCDLLISDL
jgi:hypothetical protein